MTPNHAIQNFMDQVRWLYEPEYGDFKRKVGLYLERLEEAQPQLNKGQAGRLLQAMKAFVVYTPSGDIESTRRQLLDMAHELLGQLSVKVH